MKYHLAAAAVLAALVGCSSDPIVVTCDPARGGAECLEDGLTGRCVPTCASAYYCAFPAPRSCPETDLAFGGLSANYSGTCVEACSLVGDAGPVDAGTVDAGPMDAAADAAHPADAAP